MNLKKIGYFINQALKNMSRNKVMSISTVLTVSISLFIVGAFVIFILNAGVFIKTQSDKTQLSVFVDTNLSEEQALSIGDQIKEIDGVDTVEYKSKEKAMEEMINKQGGEEQWKQLFGDDNPMPYTFIVTGTDNTKLEAISTSASQIDGVYKVDFAKDLVTKLASIVNAVRISGIVVVIILFLIAIFLISTTIKLSLYAKRKEIQVMKYVGSSNSFIQGPFLTSGMILGLFGAIVSSIVLFIVYKLLMDRIQGVQFLSLTFNPGQIALVIVILLVSGVFVGAFGSFLSLRKYLEV